VDSEFIILVSGVIAAFFGISLYMMNKVMKGLGEFYLKQKQDFMEGVKDSSTLEKYDDRGYTPLMVAFEKKWSNLIPKILQKVLELKNPLRVINHVNSAGISALLLAVELDDKDSLELLIAAGAEVNKVHMPENQTALMYAALLLKSEAVEVLLNRGAKVDVKNGDDLTVVESFLKQFRTRISKGQGREYKIYKLLSEREDDLDE
jgi:hypothetical protein